MFLPTRMFNHGLSVKLDAIRDTPVSAIHFNFRRPVLLSSAPSTNERHVTIDKLRVG